MKAFGFIRKPVSEAELKHELSGALAMIRSSRNREQFLTIRSEGALHRLPISHISYCEVKNHQIFLYVDGACFQYRDSIGTLEERLKPLGFFRCHSSYLVNGDHILRIDPSQLTLKDGSVIPVSQRRRKDFMREISDFLGKM